MGHAGHHYHSSKTGEQAARCESAKLDCTHIVTRIERGITIVSNNPQPKALNGVLDEPVNGKCKNDGNNNAKMNGKSVQCRQPGIVRKPTGAGEIERAGITPRTVKKV